MEYKFTTKSIVLLSVGILSLIFAIFCSNFEIGRIESMSLYGGDAFTGIQNAAAQTSENVYYLNKMLKNGFTFAFIIVGLGFIGASIPASRKEQVTVKLEDATENKVEKDVVETPSEQVPNTEA